MLEEQKKEVLRIAQIAETSGLCQHGSGNFSLIDREKNLFAITPHSESRFSLTPEDIIVVDLEGNVVENLGGLHPSSETLIHREILKARPEMNSVCHTHARNATAFAAMNKPIKPVVLESSMYGGICKVAPYELPGTPALAASVVKGLEGSSAVMLERHGLITIGKTMYEAYLKTVYVEEVGDINIKMAALLGGYDKIKEIPTEDMDILMRHLGMK
ncbi:MAG: class II aldolase/adducin family protein [Clostridiales Family XIII bacterium]|jgi:L-fuculose-phosphate aldolase|nr:class II aldolase/adducin family protein [Clostridiales Family XIII bacterium]